MNLLNKELIGASSVPIILATLNIKDSYGYEIIKNIKEISKDRISYSEGTLYPILHKLEKKNFIKSYWVIPESGRKRKYYKISSQGKKELAIQKNQWKDLNDILIEFLNS